MVSEIKDLNTWWNRQCAWTGRSNMVNMSMVPKFAGSQCNLNQNPTRTSLKIDKLIFNVTWKYKGPRVAILKKNRPTWRTHTT